MIEARLPGLALFIAACALAGCDDPNKHPAADRAADAPATQPAAHTLHNIIHVTDEIISGSVPDDDDGFAELERLGVRTIISVDGAAPDVARAHGMRYVHLPVGCHGIAPQRQLEIARAVRDLPGPVFIHCHHGKHRGPAAAASAAVALGHLTPDGGLAFMHKAGTSDHYAGLYQCVRELDPATADQLNAAPDAFPEIEPMPGFIKAMAAAQDALDHLKESRDAGWKAPDTHPDLVPPAEAARLENLLRALQDDPENAKHPDDFPALLRDAWQKSRDFETALNADPPPNDLPARLDQLETTCKTCHAKYRDIR